MCAFARDDRRSNYRVGPEEQRRIEIALIDPPSDCVGELLDVSIDGLSLRFPAEGDPGLQENQRVRADLALTWLEEVITVDLLARYRVPMEGFFRYGFRFADARAFFDRLDPSLWRYFNRRSAFRVSPDEHEPIKVTADWQDRKTSGLLADVSTSGVAFSVPADVQVDKGEQISVSFLFMESGSPVHFRGIVQYQKTVGDELRVGVDFVAEETSRFEAQQEDVAAYVMRRQREILRGAVGGETQAGPLLPQ